MRTAAAEHLPWNIAVSSAAIRIHEATGKFPAALTLQELRSIPELAEKSDAELAVYRNPVTGAWPRLDRADFAPGDLYMRPLTKDEKTFYAHLNPYYREKWYRDGTLLSGVYYIRIYGETKVLGSSFQFVSESTGD